MSEPVYFAQKVRFEIDGGDDLNPDFLSKRLMALYSVTADFMNDGGIKEFKEFVFNSLMMFGREKYGEISSDAEELNGENRWLGNGDYVFGRYGYFFDNRYQGKKQYDEIIRIRMWKGNTWVTYDSEMDLFLLLKDNGDDPGMVMEDLPCEED